MNRWVEEWERLDAVEPITRGAGYSHGLLEKGFRSLPDDERAVAVRAISEVLRGDDAVRRRSALWLIARLDLTDVLPELRELAARLGPAESPDAQREVREAQRLIGVLTEVAAVHYDDFEAELDRLTTRLLPPLRATKTLDLQALEALDRLIAAARRDGFFDDQIAVRLAGKLWFVFSAMLMEADHAREPEPILRAAHRYEEALLRAFGM